MEDHEKAVELSAKLNEFFRDQKTTPTIAVMAMQFQIYGIACVIAKNPKQMLIGISENMLNLSQIAKRINPEDLDVE